MVATQSHDVSIVIRTLNEERHLPSLLAAIAEQQLETPSSQRLRPEVLVVDSGSSDDSIRIARESGARLLQITPSEFSFGRSLNLGCAAARGEVLVFVSGHCVPFDSTWLGRLVDPILTGAVALAYGRQIGGPSTRYSEHQLFAKLFPAESSIPQEGFFCNNANAALRRSRWEGLRFDEDLLGLEDMDLGKRLLERGECLGYVAGATVFHHHEESWQQIRRRFEREAIALQKIRPEWHLRSLDLVRYLSASIVLDATSAIRQRRGWRELLPIAMFRLMQYWGSYRGNHAHRRLADHEKRRYFYPR